MTTYTKVCHIDDIIPNSGVCALVDGKQIAIFRLKDDSLFALDNYDPFSSANVMSRGIIGSAGDIKKVTSPIYKQGFDLTNGQCLDDDTVRLAAYPVQSLDGHVLVSSEAISTATRREEVA